MSAYVDLTRITQLQKIIGGDATSMIASMLSSLTGAIERLEAVVTTGELELAIQTAHTARNDALMLGASALQDALQEFEQAARDADESRARATLGRVLKVWPPTREELAAHLAAVGAAEAMRDPGASTNPPNDIKFSAEDDD